MVDAVCCGDDIENFANEHSFVSQTCNSEIEDKRKDLFDAVILMARRCLTCHQLSILELFLNGLTQSEMGKRLGVGQSSIHKALFGNLVYSGPYKGRRHGGIIRKLKKFCQNDDKIVAILHRIKHIRNDNLSGTLPVKKHLVPGFFRYGYHPKGERLELSSGQTIFVGIVSKKHRKAYVYKDRWYDDKAKKLAQDGYDVMELHYNGKIIEHKKQLGNQGERHVV
jgi:hypothetical protein